MLAQLCVAVTNHVWTVATGAGALAVVVDFRSTSSSARGVSEGGRTPSCDWAAEFNARKAVVTSLINADQ